MNKRKLLNVLAWFMVITLLITSFVTIYLLIDQRNAFGKIVDSSVQYHISQLDLKDGYTPIKGVDYFDGKDATDEQIGEAVQKWFQANPIKNGVDGSNGVDGRNGADAAPVTTEQIDASVKKYMEETPTLNGLTPILRCNEEKNRWELRYSQDDTWQLLNGTKVPCTVKE